METRSPGRGSAGQALGLLLIVEAGVVTSGLLSVEGRPESPGYATAPNRVSVRIDGAARSVRIRGTR